MRDLLLLALCACLGVAFWWSSRQAAEQKRAQLQGELFGLGAPQTMEASPERSLLLGQFGQGLRAHPSAETYERLARLFLVGSQLQGQEVKASAYHAWGMARVLGKALQLFDAQGRPLQPRLWTLDGGLAPLGQMFEPAGAPTLAAEGPWLLYRDARRSAVFRWQGQAVSGYLSTAKISVEGDALLLAGKKAWVWKSGQLEAATSGGDLP
jgi:hypothetical protein